MRPVLVLLLFLLTQQRAQAQTLLYQFGHRYQGGIPEIVVGLRFWANDSGITHLQLPDEFGSQNKLYRALTTIRITSPGARLERSATDSTQALVRSRPRTLVQLHYTLRQDWKGALTYPKNYRAVIDSHYLHSTGFGLLVLPKYSDSTQLYVQFDWTQMPAGWSIANSLHAGSRRFRGKVRYASFRNTLFVAGDYRPLRTIVRGKPVQVAIRGKDWKFTDSAFLGAVERVVGTMRSFWNDDSEPYYLVTLTPFSGVGHYNGSALHQAFLLAMTKEFGIDAYLYGLLGHEYFHRWNGVTMTMQGQERENTWFGEGFTDFFTYRLLYAARLLSTEEYLEQVNTRIAEYYLSPARNADKATIGRNFWTQREFQELPYRKGFVYALQLDQRIRENSKGKHSMDDVMRDLYRAAMNGRMPTDSSFCTLVATYIGKEINTEHRTYINEGATIPVLPGSLGSGFADKVEELAPFELGFNWDSTANTRTITGVVKESAAWKAGLRDGMKWKGGSIYFNNIRQPALVKIEEDGVIREISYLPAAARRVQVRQFFPARAQ